jgi:hypothetical protein
MPSDAETDAQPKDAQTAPWTVKGMPRKHRDAINAAARRADMTVAQYLWAACEAQIQADRVPIGTARGRHTRAALIPAGEASQGGASTADELARLTEVALRLSPDGKDTAVLKVARRAVIARLTEFE